MLKKINLMLFILAALTLISCDDDFLETSPTDAISAADALATAENMALNINGLHRGLFSQSQTVLPGGNTARANNHYYIPMGDNLVGGIIQTADANNLGWRTNMQWNDHTLETSLTNRLLWYHRYNIIGSVNNIIKKGEDGSLVLDARLQEILGQAYTYRAYAYLSLVQHYAKGYLIGNPATDPGVPILFESEAPYTSQPRSTVQQVYDQMMLDIDEAINYFDGATQRPSSIEGKSQLNIDVAYGLKARIALNSGQWRVAADAAKAARANYPIMGEDEWLSGFNSNGISEVIWGSHVIGAETTFFRSYFYLMCNTFNGAQNRGNPKIADRRLIDATPDTDYRKKAFLVDAPNTNSSASNNLGGLDSDGNPVDPSIDRATYDSRNAEIRAQYGISNRHNLHPYLHVKMLQKNPGSIDPDDIIYMRSSEMYLIEAEAEAMLNNVTAAQNALRPLGEERDSDYDVSIYNSKTSLIEHIKFQRKLELWGEGFGYTDYIRWDEGIDHAADGGSGASNILYQNAYFQERPSMNDDWIFKIPQAEIDANPNIGPGDQN